MLCTNRSTKETKIVALEPNSGGWRIRLRGDAQELVLGAKLAPSEKLSLQLRFVGGTDWLQITGQYAGHNDKATLKFLPPTQVRRRWQGRVVLARQAVGGRQW